MVQKIGSSPFKEVRKPNESGEKVANLVFARPGLLPDSISMVHEIVRDFSMGEPNAFSPVFRFCELDEFLDPALVLLGYRLAVFSVEEFPDAFPERHERRRFVYGSNFFCESLHIFL